MYSIVDVLFQSGTQNTILISYIGLYFSTYNKMYKVEKRKENKINKF